MHSLTKVHGSQRKSEDPAKSTYSIFAFFSRPCYLECLMNLVHDIISVIMNTTTVHIQNHVVWNKATRSVMCMQLSRL